MDSGVASSRRRRPTLLALLLWTLWTFWACGLAHAAALSVKLVPTAGAAAVSGGDLYVDSGSIGGRCDDSRPVSGVGISTPWCSLGRAFSAAPADSTVHVRAGSYPTVSLAFYRPSSNVTFEGYGGEWPVVQGFLIGSRSLNRSGNFSLEHLKITNPAVKLTNVSNVVIYNNEIAMTPVAPTNCSAATQSCQINTPVGVSLDVPASNITVQNNNMHDGASGVWLHNGNAPSAPGQPLSTTYQHIVVQGNTFSNMGDVVLGIQNYQDVRVVGNVFVNDHMRPDIDPYCHCDTVHVIGGGDQLLLDGNVAYGSRGFLLQPGPPWGNCAPTCQQLTNVTVENNVLVGPDFSLRVISSPGIRIVNNTIWGSQERSDLGLLFFADPPATTGAVLENNIIRDFEVYTGVAFTAEDHNIIANRAVGPGFSTPLGIHDLLSTPQFTAPTAATPNFELQPGSPGIQAGDASAAPPQDVLGQARADPPTIGAYEYVPNATGSAIPVAGNLVAGGSSGSGATGGSGAAAPGGAGATGVQPTTQLLKVTNHGRAQKVRRGDSVYLHTGVELICGRTGRRCPLEIQVTATDSRGRAAAARGAGQRILRRQVSLAPGRARLVLVRVYRRALRRLLKAHHKASVTMLVMAPSGSGWHGCLRRVFYVR